MRLEQLKQLAALRDSGALTEAEFEAEKRRILESYGVELTYRGVGAAAQFLGGQLGEPAFDEVQPGRAGRGEMQNEAGMVCQPTLYRRCLMGRGVVENQVDVEIGGHFTVDFAQEGQELGGA